MAHFAKISENNEVLSIMVVADSDTQNEQGQETESVGQNFCQTHFSWPAHLWIQCSYNTKLGVHKLGGTPLRGNYPEMGDIWDSENQIFIEPKPYSSWVKNVAEARWQSPIGDAPELTEEQVNQINSNTNGWYYDWDEENQTWNLLDLKT